MGCMKTEHDNTTDIGVCQGCLTDAEAEVTKLKLQNDEIREGEACDRQVMDEFAREFFGDQEGTLWLPGLTLKKLLEMVRDRFVEKRKDATQ